MSYTQLYYTNLTSCKRQKKKKPYIILTSTKPHSNHNINIPKSRMPTSPMTPSVCPMTAPFTPPYVYPSNYRMMGNNPIQSMLNQQYQQYHNGSNNNGVGFGDVYINPAFFDPNGRNNRNA